MFQKKVVCCQDSYIYEGTRHKSSAFKENPGTNPVKDFRKIINLENIDILLLLQFPTFPSLYE